MFSFQRNISKTTIITDIIKIYLKVLSFYYEVLEGLMLKLKSHLMQRADSLEKTLVLRQTRGRGEGGNRG